VDKAGRLKGLYATWRWDIDTADSAPVRLLQSRQSGAVT
jgi:hypothetical protein